MTQNILLLFEDPAVVNAIVGLMELANIQANFHVCRERIQGEAILLDGDTVFVLAIVQFYLGKQHLNTEELIKQLHAKNVPLLVMSTEQVSLNVIKQLGLTPPPAMLMMPYPRNTLLPTVLRLLNISGS